MSPESARPLRTGTSMPGCQRSRSFASDGCGAQREGLEDAEHLVDALGVRVADGEVADGAVERGGQRPAQVGVGTRLDLAGAPARVLRHRPQLAEQHRLADPAQPGQHEAAFGAAAGDALEDDLERVQLLVPAGQLGRPLACAGGERVAHGVHGSDGIGNS